MVSVILTALRDHYEEFMAVLTFNDELTEMPVGCTIHTHRLSYAVGIFLTSGKKKEVKRRSDKKTSSLKLKVF